MSCRNFHSREQNGTVQKQQMRQIIFSQGVVVQPGIQLTAGDFVERHHSHNVIRIPLQRIVLLLSNQNLNYGILFHGTLGSMRVDRRGYEIFSFPQNGGCEPLKVDHAKEMPMYVNHWANFADCIRSRERPICDVEVGHNTTTVCHIGTCAYIAGGRLEWDPIREEFHGGDLDAVDKATKWANREYQNGWSLSPPYYEQWKA